MAADTVLQQQEIAQPQRQQGRFGKLWQEIKKNRWAYFFISPFYILFLIFGLFPVGFSLYLAFFRWNGVRAMEYVGFANFEFLLGPGGRAFWRSVENSLILFVMYVPIMTIMAIVLAVILNSDRIRGFRIFRTLIFAPYVTSMIAAGITFGLMFATDGGLINLILGVFGIEPVPWLDDVWFARIALCILIVWGWLGYNMVLMLAGLQQIPKELNEAALIDGASWSQILIYITIPLMRPIILFSVVLSTIGTFGLFNEVMALTGGGPLRATTTPLVEIYNNAFSRFRFGRASAQAYVYTFIIFMLTMAQFSLASRGGDDEGMGSNL
jgi:ABC-type sugar transport system permease subunit